MMAHRAGWRLAATVVGWAIAAVVRARRLPAMVAVVVGGDYGQAAAA